MAPSTPPNAADLELDLELDVMEEDPDLFEPEGECSMTQRWQSIKTETGIEDGYLMD